MSDFPPIEQPAKLKVAELKEELDKRGLPTSGLKKDLVTRLEEAQGLIQPPDPTTGNTGALYPPPALPSTKGDDEDHAKPADEVMDAALPPKEMSDTNAPAVREDIIDPEVAAAHHPEQSHSVVPPKLDDEDKKHEEEKGETGVGHVMVEGGAETTREIREAEKEIIKSPETSIQADLQPAALDSEVAKVIAEEEMKDTIPASPTPMRSASPVSVDPENFKSESRVNTPPLEVDDEDVLDLGEGEGTKKRARGEDSAPPPKRPRRQFPPLPSSLSHLIHPPTTCLYISNLRRPLLLPALHEFVFPDYDSDAEADSSHSSLLPPPKGPFASSEYPNVWLSGIKSHAYAVFSTVDECTKAAERIDGQIFPEETGAKLGVEFVDEDEITRLVQREEDAWAGRRQKLDLKVTKVEDGYKFELQGAGSIGARSVRGGPGQGQGGGQGARGGMNGRGPVGVPFTGRPTTGINATPVGPRGGAQAPSRPPPAGPGGRGGFGGRGAPPHRDRERERDGRPGPNGFGGGGRERMGDSYVPGNGNGAGGGGRGGFGDRRTKVRPELSWREGPRAR